tara:strand:+ start:169 stop:555 length:387 start_codon:yes stop_codon:yes gene_type:complete
MLARDKNTYAPCASLGIVAHVFLPVMRVLYTRREPYVSEENIKKIVKRYKLLSSFWLFIFLIIAIFANWALIDSNIRNHSELGLEYYSSDTGFIWGAIIVGLNVVLQLFFYSLEKILLFLQQESSSSN